MPPQENIWARGWKYGAEAVEIIHIGFVRVLIWRRGTRKKGPLVIRQKKEKEGVLP